MLHEIPNQSGDDSRQSSISDELDFIYQNQSESIVNAGFSAERVINAEIRRLYKLADEIVVARSYRVEAQFLVGNARKKNIISGVAKAVFSRALPIVRDNPLTEADLKIQESAFGATIFGETRPGERREFFYDGRIADRDSWFFHQEIAAQGGSQEVTLHYEVHPHGVLRISSNPDTKNDFIDGQELSDFLSATRIYHQLVMEQMYNHDLYSSEKAA